MKNLFAGSRWKLIKSLFRVLVSTALMIYVLSSVDLPLLLTNVRQAQLGLLAAVVPILLISAVIAAVRWQLLLRETGYRTSVWHIWQILQASAFYGLFAPGLMGAEVARWLKVSQDEGDRPVSAAVSVAIDRLIGLTALILLGAILSLAIPSGLVTPPVRLVVSGMLLLSLLFWLVILIPLERILPAFIKQPGQRISRTLQQRFGLAEKLILAIGAYRGKWLVICSAMGLSLLYHSMNALFNLLLALAIGIDIGYVDIYLVYAVAALLTSIPISVAGIGVREISFIGLLTQLGYDQSLVAALPILKFAITVAWRFIVGGGIELSGGVRSMIRNLPVVLDPSEQDGFKPSG